jgi:HK97 family phage portal protein
VTEVARWFNIPEFMLANNYPTYSNIENFANHFITHNVRPRVRMYEQEFNWKLLGNYPNFYTEFNMDALVRADLKTQAEYFVRATGGNSWMTRNEVRSLKNLNKDNDSGRGDAYLEPLNAATEKERDEQGNQDA